MFHVQSLTGICCPVMATSIVRTLDDVGKVKDEVREVAPGVDLGLAYLTMRDGEHLGCFFGISKT